MQVEDYVRPFNRDGRVFITEAADAVYAAFKNGEYATVRMTNKERSKRKRAIAQGQAPESLPEPERVPIPATIAHFVMNLPATATTFLPHFRGLYAGREELFAPHAGGGDGGGAKLPMVHVHCFAPKVEDDSSVREVCGRLAAELGVAFAPGDDPEEPGKTAVHNVRTVAPNKDMFCASFRLPPEVAFAPRP